MGYFFVLSYDLRHLRCFVAVAEELHFTHAARRLHMAQPTVSRTISHLELLTGLTLFQRSTRSVALTPDGEGLLIEAREVLRAADQLQDRVAEMTTRAGQTLVVGLHDEGAAELTPPILQAYAVAEPGVTVTLRTIEYHDAHTTLDTGASDVVIGGGSWSEAYDVRTLFHDERGVVVGPGHPFYDAEAVPLEELLETPLLGMEDAHAEAEAFFGVYGFLDHRNGDTDVRRAGEVRNMWTALYLLMNNRGALGSTASTQRFANLGPARYVPVLGATPVAATAAIPGRSATAAQQNLLAVAEQTADALAARLVPSAVPPARAVEDQAAAGTRGGTQESGPCDHRHVCGPCGAQRVRPPDQLVERRGDLVAVAGVARPSRASSARTRRPRPASPPTPRWPGRRTSASPRASACPETAAASRAGPRARR